MFKTGQRIRQKNKVYTVEQIDEKTGDVYLLPEGQRYGEFIPLSGKYEIL